MAGGERAKQPHQAVSTPTRARVGAEIGGLFSVGSCSCPSGRFGYETEPGSQSVPRWPSIDKAFRPHPSNGGPHRMPIMLTPNLPPLSLSPLFWPPSPVPLPSLLAPLPCPSPLSSAPLPCPQPGGQLQRAESPGSSQGHSHSLGSFQ